MKLYAYFGFDRIPTLEEIEKRYQELMKGNLSDDEREILNSIYDTFSKNVSFRVTYEECCKIYLNLKNSFNIYAMLRLALVNQDDNYFIYLVKELDHESFVPKEMAEELLRHNVNFNRKNLRHCRELIDKMSCSQAVSDKLISGFESYCQRNEAISYLQNTELDLLKSSIDLTPHLHDPTLLDAWFNCDISDDGKRYKGKGNEGKRERFHNYHEKLFGILTQYLVPPFSMYMQGLADPKKHRQLYLLAKYEEEFRHLTSAQVNMFLMRGILCNYEQYELQNVFSKMLSRNLKGITVEVLNAAYKYLDGNGHDLLIALRERFLNCEIESDRRDEILKWCSEKAREESDSDTPRKKSRTYFFGLLYFNANKIKGLMQSTSNASEEYSDFRKKLPGSHVINLGNSISSILNAEREDNLVRLSSSGSEPAQKKMRDLTNPSMRPST